MHRELSSGGIRFSARPRSQTPPASGCSNPATIRSSVVLPQPDGPSRQKKSPRETSKSTPLRASTPSKDLVTPTTRNQPDTGSISDIGLGSAMSLKYSSD